MKELRRLAAAAGYSWRGLRRTWRDEAAFRLECAAAALLLPLAFWLDVGGGERALLIFSVLSVPALELLNTAVEAAADLASPQRSDLAGKAKDAGSAAVFVAVVAAAVVWGVVLI